MAPSHSSLVSRDAGSMAQEAEYKKAQKYQPFSCTFLYPNRCGDDGRIWPRSTQLLPRARPTHKERNRRPHDPPIPCTTCLGYHPARECRSCSWVHWGGECGVIIKFSLFIYISFNFIQVYCIVFISFFIVFIYLFIFHYYCIYLKNKKIKK